MHAKNHRAIIIQKQKHLIHNEAQAVHHGESSFANWEGGCISVKSGIMLLNSNITTIEAGERRRTDVTDHTVASFCTLLPDKEKTMGAKDTKAKEYLSDNRRFADLCNAVLFDGEQTIKAENLQERDTAEVLSVLGADGNEVLLQKARDLLKQVIVKSCGSAYIMLIGIEAQADVHYSMPVKVMTYDALNYGAQVKNTARNHRDAGEYGTGAEFLSGFHKGDKLTPVITITVYLGSKPWDGPRSLYDMLGSIDDRLKRFVCDYPINLVIPQEIKDFSRFKTSLGAVFEVIKASEDKQSMKKLFTQNPKYKAMDNESVLAINTFIGVDIPVNEEGSETDMCKAWEDQRKEDLEEGMEKGIELTKQVIRLSVQGHTLEEISKETKIPKEKVQYILE